MPGAVQHVGEVLGAVAGTVVGDDPVDVDDAVGVPQHRTPADDALLAQLEGIRDADHFPGSAEDFDTCDHVGGCGCGLVMWYRGPVM